MAIRIAINGFGRIGRAAFRIALNNKKVQVVAINDLMDTTTLAHLLKYDTVYGTFDKKVVATKKGIKVDGVEYPVFAQKNPADLPWKEHKVDVVLECTGFFETQESSMAHCEAGAKRVIISAPAKDDTQTLVLGTAFTEQKLQKKDSTNKVLSNASCTTNNLGSVMQVLEDAFGVEKALLTTIHSYTSTQNLVDGPNKDLRRARAAAENLVPTSTGAAEATAKVLPSLEDKFDGISVRVPTPTVSLSDITVLLKKNTTVEAVQKAFTDAAKQASYKGILGVTSEPLVSSDFKGNSYSAIVDLELVRVVGGNLVKVLAWYDNEWGYANRLVEMAIRVK